MILKAKQHHVSSDYISLCFSIIDANINCYLTVSKGRREQYVIEIEMPGPVPQSWPDLIGMELNTAVEIISRERPDVRIVRVLPPGEAPSPPPRDQVRVIIYNNVGPVPNTWMVVAPAPYIG